MPQDTINLYPGDAVVLVLDTMLRASAPPIHGLEAAVDLIDRDLQPAAIMVYGSAASGRLRPESDIDIAVLLDRRRVDPFELAAVRTAVEAVVGRDVDLVVLDTASPILAMEVLRQHRVMATRNPQRLESFVVQTLGAYFDLKRVRRPIEDAIQRRFTTT